MRVIKFRAWDKATQAHWYPSPQGMIYFDLYDVPEFVGQTFCESDEDTFKQRFVVMQFTGLHDKNGKEIYEGDILIFWS